MLHHLTMGVINNANPLWYDGLKGYWCFAVGHWKTTATNFQGNEERKLCWNFDGDLSSWNS